MSEWTMSMSGFFFFAMLSISVDMSTAVKFAPAEEVFRFRVWMIRPVPLPMSSILLFRISGRSLMSSSFSKESRYDNLSSYFDAYRS